MLVSKNNFLVEVDSQFVQPAMKGFFIDTDFNPKLLSTKIGRIHTESIGVTAPSIYDVPLHQGDVVVFGHLVCQKKNMVHDNVFRCAYHSIFAKIVNNELKPLEEIMFCEPMRDEDQEFGGMIIPGGVSGTRAKVFELSEACKKAGIQKGDIVFFTKNADYGIDVLGKELYMMRIRNVIGIERDGVLKTFRNKLLVKNVTQLGSIGSIDKIYHQTSLQTGEVVESGKTGIVTGSVVTYLNGIASIVRWNGVDYAFIDETHIKYFK
ncbi:MAG: hypothetical protein V4721_10245 [Bacteroidota bacterium]